MYLKHKVFGKLFNIFTKFPINNNLISFIIDSNESFSSNLEYIKNEFESRGDFEFNYYYKDKLSINSLKKASKIHRMGSLWLFHARIGFVVF